MLIGTFVKLEFERVETMVANALVDSFCIHALNLNQFFQQDGGPDTLRAGDFTDNAYAPRPYDARRKKLMRAVQQRVTPVSRSLIAAGRVGSSERREAFIMLTAEVERFTRHLHPSLRGAWKYCPE
jgi:hypothetical protein